MLDPSDFADFIKMKILISVIVKLSFGKMERERSGGKKAVLRRLSHSCASVNHGIRICLEP